MWLTLQVDETGVCVEVTVLVGVGVFGVGVAVLVGVGMLGVDVTLTVAVDVFVVGDTTAVAVGVLPVGEPEHAASIISNATRKNKPERVM